MTTLKKMLQGYRLGFPQSVGLMRVVPILTDTEFTQVGDIESIYLKKDMEYDKLLMANESQHIAVIPHGLMYVVAEEAQDRTIPSVHLIAKEKQVNANCLQPSQGGYMGEANREREWGILPRSLKGPAWEHAQEKRYDALWSDIERFMTSVGLSGREIILFFKEFKTELETFVAQFEPVDKQVGALFIINNFLVGIELVPNYKIWQQMWRPLVRDCYGSEVIKFVKKGHTSGMFHPLLKDSGITTIGDLESAVDDLLVEEEEFTNDIIKEVYDENITENEEEVLENFTLFGLQSEHLMGQSVQHGPERTIYLSLITRHAEKSAEKKREFDSRWNTNSPYEKDKEFSLNSSK